MDQGRPVLGYLHWVAATGRLAEKPRRGFTCVCFQESPSNSCVWFKVYVLKRPHVDEFLQKMGELFECVLFTASLAKVRLRTTASHFKKQKS